jgi:hypothetical protein
MARQPDVLGVVNFRVHGDVCHFEGKEITSKERVHQQTKGIQVEHVSSVSLGACRVREAELDFKGKDF